MKIATRSAAEHGAEDQAARTWVCPMHSQVQANHAGKCPVCGMDLVLKSAAGAPRPGLASGASGEPPGLLVQNLAVRLATVSRRELSQEIVTYGTAITPAPDVLTMTPKVEGWIRALHAATVGQKVAANQPLYDFYSPELIQRQREYIDLLNRKEKLSAQVRDVTGQNAAMLAAMARDRVNMRRTLLAADVDVATLDTIERIRRPVEVITVRALQPSFVTAVSVSAGAYVTPMTPIIALASENSVWIDVIIYPDQVDWIRGGEAATIRSGDYVATGRLTLPNALVDPVSKVLHGRIELPFADTIRPGTATTVTLASRPRHVLAVASSALIRRARGEYVMRWEDSGHFRPVEVTVGIRSRDFVEIRSGLREGERAAAEGEFLLEADSSLDQVPAEPL